MKKLGDMDLTLIVVLLIAVSLALRIGGILSQSLSYVQAPVIPDIYAYSLSAGFGVLLLGFIAKTVVRLKLNWKRVALFSLLIPALAVHAYPLLTSPNIVLHVVTPSGEIDIPGSGKLEGQWVRAEILLIPRMVRGYATYTIILVNKTGVPYALVDKVVTVEPKFEKLASKVADVPVRPMAPDGCYNISMSVTISINETDFSLHDRIGRTCVKSGYFYGVEGFHAETKVFGPLMSSFSEAWDLLATSVTLAAVILTVWKGEVKGGDLLAMTFLISLFIVRVIMKLFC